VFFWGIWSICFYQEGVVDIPLFDGVSNKGNSRKKREGLFSCEDTLQSMVTVEQCMSNQNNWFCFGRAESWLLQWNKQQEILDAKAKRFYKSFLIIVAPQEGPFNGGNSFRLKTYFKVEGYKPSGIRFYQQTARSTGCGGGCLVRKAVRVSWVTPIWRNWRILDWG